MNRRNILPDTDKPLSATICTPKACDTIEIGETPSQKWTLWKCRFCGAHGIISDAEIDEHGSLFAVLKAKGRLHDDPKHPPILPTT